MKSLIIRALFNLDKINRKIIGIIIEKTSPSLYQFSDTCQIPNLSKIYELFFGVNNGYLVEIGAYDGKTYSNTSGLLKKGWKGLLVEPVPEFFQMASNFYSEYPNVKLVNRAIGEASGKLTLNISGPLTTGSEKLLSRYQNISWASKFLTSKSIEVPVCTLSETLEEYGVPRDFEILVVDVEGLESEVMNGLRWDVFHPKMIIIELADFHPDFENLRQTNRALARKIIANRYEIAYKDSINTIFISQDFLTDLDSSKSNQMPTD